MHPVSRKRCTNARPTPLFAPVTSAVAPDIFMDRLDQVGSQPKMVSASLSPSAATGESKTAAASNRKHA
jgi:hypothetical protein